MKTLQFEISDKLYAKMHRRYRNVGAQQLEKWFNDSFTLMCLKGIFLHAEDTNITSISVDYSAVTELGSKKGGDISIKLREDRFV